MRPGCSRVHLLLVPREGPAEYSYFSFPRGASRVQLLHVPREGPAERGGLVFKQSVAHLHRALRGARAPRGNPPSPLAHGAPPGGGAL